MVCSLPSFQVKLHLYFEMCTRVNNNIFDHFWYIKYIRYIKYIGKEHSLVVCKTKLPFDYTTNKVLQIN